MGWDLQRDQRWWPLPFGRDSASPDPGDGAHSVWLAALEPLEPLLAAMPMGSQEALDLQEEACEAYGHLRRVVLQAARV